MSYTSGGDPAGPAGRPHQLRWGSVERVTSEAAPETGAEGWADVEALSDSFLALGGQDRVQAVARGGEARLRPGAAARVQVR